MTLGIVLVSHGDLAREFLLALEHIVGQQDHVAWVSIFPEDDMELKRQAIRDAIAKVNQGQGVVIATDMFGGTPSNLALSLLGDEPVEIIAGMNLPMLIKLSSVRHQGSLKNAVLQAEEAGKKYITIASELLRSEKLT